MLPQVASVGCPNHQAAGNSAKENAVHNGRNWISSFTRCHCQTSQSSSTSAISPISHSRSVIPAAIACDMRAAVQRRPSRRSLQLPTCSIRAYRDGDQTRGRPALSGSAGLPCFKRAQMVHPLARSPEPLVSAGYARCPEVCVRRVVWAAGVIIMKCCDIVPIT